MRAKSTAGQVVSRNGYLFLRHSAANQTADAIERPIDNNLSSTSYMSAFDDTSLEKPKRTIRIKSSAKFFNRFKFFESLPKYSLEQPCINIASPYEGSEE